MVHHTIGYFDAYRVVADTLWLQENARVVYMDAELKVVKCDDPSMFAVLWTRDEPGGQFPKGHGAWYAIMDMSALRESVTSYSTDLWMRVAYGIRYGWYGMYEPGL